MADIGDKIMYNNVNYSATYKKLTNDTNTNTILTAITLRNVHLNTDPLGLQASKDKENPPSADNYYSSSYTLSNPVTFGPVV